MLLFALVIPLAAAVVDLSTDEKRIAYLAAEIDREHPEGRRSGMRLLHDDDPFDATIRLTLQGRWIKTPSGELFFPSTRALEDPDAIRQLSAMSALMNYPGNAGNAYLAKLTRHPNFLVRLSAATALDSKLPRPEESDALIALLSDPNPDVKLAAILALGPKTPMVGGGPEYNGYTPYPPVFDALKGFLSSTNVNERIAVTNTFLFLSDPRAVVPLVPLLSDRDARVRDMASQTLTSLRAVDHFYHDRQLVSQISSEFLPILTEYVRNCPPTGTDEAKAVLLEIEHQRFLSSHIFSNEIGPNFEPVTVVNPKDRQTYVRIGAGSFPMGCSAGDFECTDDEKPAHTATVQRPFWMGQTLVTISAWKRYAQQSTSPAVRKAYKDAVKDWASLGRPHAEDEPITLDWHGAADYCAWIGGRLPTEVEWEYAARAGSVSARYGILNDIAWYHTNSGTGMQPVGRKLPNRWQLYDMLGDVWQWTSGWYSSYEQVATTVGERVLRGGSWRSDPSGIRASARLRVPENNPVLIRDVTGWSRPDIGFRCVAQ